MQSCAAASMPAGVVKRVTLAASTVRRAVISLPVGLGTGEVVSQRDEGGS